MTFPKSDPNPTTREGREVVILPVAISSLPEEVRADLIEWLTALAKRAVAGHRYYGDKSQYRTAAELIGEQVEEITDVVGWTFPRFQQLRRKQREAEGP